MTHSLRQHGGGFTLIEALLAAVVLAVVTAAITMPFAAGSQSQQENVRRQAAVSLAQGMMEEVLSRPFLDPQGGEFIQGPESGEAARSQFDNIDDYHGYSEPAGQIKDALGEAVDDEDARELTRDVKVIYVYLDGQDTGKPPSFVRIMVEVKYNNKPVVTLTRLVSSLH